MPNVGQVDMIPCVTCITPVPEMPLAPVATTYPPIHRPPPRLECHIYIPHDVTEARTCHFPPVALTRPGEGAGARLGGDNSVNEGRGRSRGGSEGKEKMGRNVDKMKRREMSKRSIENARNVYGQFRLSLSEYTRGEKRERWESQEKEERKKCEKREEHRKQKGKNRLTKTL